MNPTKVEVWRVKHAHYDDICIRSTEDLSLVLKSPTYFYPLSLPLEAAKAVFGADVVVQITEEPVKATLSMEIQHD